MDLLPFQAGARCGAMKTRRAATPTLRLRFGSISLVAKKLTSLSKVSSSLEEDAPGLLPAHPVGTRVLVLKHLSADKRVVEGEAFAKPRSGMPSRPLPPTAVPARRARAVASNSGVPRRSRASAQWRARPGPPRARSGSSSR